MRQIILFIVSLTVLMLAFSLRGQDRTDILLAGVVSLLYFIGFFVAELVDSIKEKK